MKINKFIICFIIILLIYSAFTVKTYAISDMIHDADAFLGMGDDVEEVINEDSLQDVSSFFYKAFLAVGIIIALVIGVVIGVKYIYESAEGQAKLKEAFIPYIIGCLILFSAFPIWKMVINFGNEQNMIEEQSKELYDEIVNIFSSQGLDSATDNQIEGAWRYISQTMYPDLKNAQIVWENKNNVIAWVFVEYLSRFANNSTIISEWNNFISYTKPISQSAVDQALNTWGAIREFNKLYIDAYNQENEK